MQENLEQKRKHWEIQCFQCFPTSPRRLERPTYRLGGDRSIQLSYEDLYEKFANKQIIQLWNCWSTLWGFSFADSITARPQEN